MHVIPGLQVGGAETMLFNLLIASRGSGWEHEVVSMTGVGEVGPRMRDAGFVVHSLGMTNGVPNPIALFRLRNILVERAPSIVQTWIHHADLLGGIAARLAGGIPVVWGIRQSGVQTDKWLKKILARIVNPPLSYVIPRAIVCCAEEARRVHEGFGYAPGKMIVIPNGFSLSRFDARAERRHRARSALGIAADELIVGMVARLHEMKDHRNFVLAAAGVAAEFPSARFLLCGPGITPQSAELMGWLREGGIEESKFLLLGYRDDLDGVYPALDVNVLSSYAAEGFPNVLGEAMACGVPCVATDVGDSALVVGDAGRIVPPRNPRALAGAIIELLTMPGDERRNLGLKARRRIEDRFSIESAVGHYNALYSRVLSDHP